MTDSVEARLAVLETQMKQVLAEQHEQGADIKKLLAAANMAGGAWQATLKIGGLLVVASSAIYGLMTMILKAMGKG